MLCCTVRNKHSQDLAAHSLAQTSCVLTTLASVQAMNRSLANVILGGYSITAKEVAEKGEALQHQETDIAGAVDAVTSARQVIIVPGYGLAVASAQYAIAELVKTLTSKGIKVRSVSA